MRTVIKNPGYTLARLITASTVICEQMSNKTGSKVVRRLFRSENYAEQVPFEKVSQINVTNLLSTKNGLFVR